MTPVVNSNASNIDLNNLGMISWINLNINGDAGIDEEFKKPLLEVSAEISDTPVAAASLGQVYKAVLSEGNHTVWGKRRVAVKFQRPGLVEQLALDVYVLRVLPAVVNRWRKLTVGRTVSFNTVLPIVTTDFSVILAQLLWTVVLALLHFQLLQY